MKKLQGNLNLSALLKLEAYNKTHGIAVHVTGWNSDKLGSKGLALDFLFQYSEKFRAKRRVRDTKTKGFFSANSKNNTLTFDDTEI